MAAQKKNQNRKDDGHVYMAKPTITIVINPRPMDERQEQRLSTAVDALLAEWVRQEIGRAKQP